MLVRIRLEDYQMTDVVIIGGGAAGMMAGIILARQGYSPEIFEKNDRLGKKLFITGKGRCNLTNNCDFDTLMSNIVTNPRFMYSAFSKFNPSDTLAFFEELGLSVKTERGNRVFPSSDHSFDVIDALSKELRRLRVPVNLEATVKDILTEKDDENKENVSGIIVKYADNKIKEIKSSYVVVATGGVSYQATGSTGDGIKWANKLGLSCEKTLPSLVSICTKESFCKDIMGLSLRNISVKFTSNVKGKTKVVYEDFGEMIFTHFGVSGPVILSASSYLHKYMEPGITLSINLKPALSLEQLDNRILRDFSNNLNKNFQNSLNDLLPQKLIPIVISMAGINPYKKVNSISKEERQNLIKAITNFNLEVTGFRGFEEAIITKGGVSVKEINPQNMESKKIKGLHFIGEVLDVDALTGGFNLQVAWSTAAALI